MVTARQQHDVYIEEPEGPWRHSETHYVGWELSVHGDLCTTNRQGPSTELKQSAVPRFGMSGVIESIVDNTKMNAFVYNLIVFKARMVLVASGNDCFEIVEKQ